MREMLCTLHNVTFGCEGDLPEGVIIRCPVCTQSELNKLRVELHNSEQTRTALSRAISIKMEEVWKETKP